MCLAPIHIYNRSTFININAAPLYQEVPCGKCAECRQNKLNEYLFRAYYHFKYQSQSTHYAFGFCDTLTYNTAALLTRSPYGIPSFSRKDIQLFLKRLRRSLELSGYVVKDNLSYFVTCEYGGEKHRPHYHIFFFSRIPQLDVFTFKKHINMSWVIRGLKKGEKVFNEFGEPAAHLRLGYTDSWYNTLKHVHRYSDCNTSFFSGLYYVSKYIHKDQDYLNVVNTEIQNIRDKYNSGNYTNLERDAALQKFDEVMRPCMPFHLQSKGFGLGFMNEADIDQLCLSTKVQLPDSSSVIKDYELPTYYKRKIFYDRLPNGYYDNGKPKYRYELNNLGLRYKRNTFDQTLESFRKRYYDILSNLHDYCPIDFYKQNKPIIYEEITKMFDGRTLMDFIIYKVCYKGKIITSDIKKFYELLPKIDLSKYKDFYFRQYYEKLFANNLWDCFVDRNTALNARRALRQVAICQYSRDEFRYFDDLDNFIQTFMDIKNKMVQQRHDQIEKLYSKLKILMPDIR